MITEIKTDEDLVNAIKIVLKLTTSRQKRRNTLTGIHRVLKYDPYLLDAFFDYALKSEPLMHRNFCQN